MASVISNGFGRFWFLIFFFSLSCAGGRAYADFQEFRNLKLDTGLLMLRLEAAAHYWKVGKPDSSKRLFLQVVRSSQLMQFPYGIAKGLVGLGNIAAYQGHTEQALDYYNRAVPACRDARSRTVLTTIYNNIGNVYLFRSDFSNSRHYYQKAIDFSKQFGAELPLETMYNNISVTLIQLRLPDRAISYLEAAEKMAIGHDNRFTLADIYNNLGSAYAYKQEQERAFRYFREAARVASLEGYIHTQHSALVNQGLGYLNGGDPERALTYFTEAERLAGKVTAYYENLRILGMGAAFSKMKHYTAALPYLQKALQLGNRLGNRNDLVKTHGMLAELYANTGQFEQAFVHKFEEKKLTDSLNQEAIRRQVSETEVKYQTALKDKALEEQKLQLDLQEEKLNSRNYLIYGAALGVLLLIGFLFVQKRQFAHKQKLRNEVLFQLERNSALEQMKALQEGEEKERTRLAREIHDGIMVQFSAIKMHLSAFSGTGPEEFTPENLEPIIKKLDDATDHLRNTAHNLMPDMLLEEGLSEALEYFCHNLQKGMDLTIQLQLFGILPRLQAWYELSLYRIVQELLQNALKHAAAKTVIVQLSFENRLLAVTVEDDGLGMADTTKTGFGLKTIKSRMPHMKGRMEMESKPVVGTTVHLEFDIVPEFLKPTGSEMATLYPKPVAL